MDTSLKNLLCLYGMSEYKTAFFDSDEYKRLRSCFFNELDAGNVFLPNWRLCGLSEIKRDGKMVIGKHTEGIDTRIPYSYADALSSEVFARFGTHPKEECFEEIARYIENNCDLLRVDDIPVFTNLTNPNNGYVSHKYFYDSDSPSYTSLFEIMPVIVGELALMGTLDVSSKTIYVHEMYHALSGRNKGFTKNYLYNEVLPIFMERVATLDLDEECVDATIFKRLIGIKRDIIALENEMAYGDDDMNSQQYIISTLLATSLFNTYWRGSNKVKREMDSDVNRVLVGECVLEDVLDKYEACEERGSCLVRRQIKNYRK